MSNNENSSGLKELLLLIGGIVALALVLEKAALIVETYVHYLPTEGIVPQIFYYLDTFGPLVLMLSIGLSVVWDKSDLLKLVVLVCGAAIIIFQFFPDVRSTIEGYLNVAPIE